MRVELIGHFKACMTDIYLRIDARVADYIHTHPYLGLLPRLRAYSALCTRRRNDYCDNSYLRTAHNNAAQQS